MWALWLSSSVAGCGSAKRFDGAVYQDDKVSFRVPPAPREWRAIEVSDANLAYRDDAHEASILINGRCGKRDEDTPLTALTNHLIMGTTERHFVTQKTVPLDSREALHSILQAKLDGVPMHYDIFVMKKDGCVYDFVYVSTPGRFAEGTPAFEQFVQGIHTLGSGGS